MAGGNIARILATMTIIDNHCDGDQWSMVFKSQNIFTLILWQVAILRVSMQQLPSLVIIAMMMIAIFRSETQILKCKSFLRWLGVVHILRIHGGEGSSQMITVLHRGGPANYYGIT